MRKTLLFGATILFFSIISNYNATLAQSKWDFDAAVYGWFAGMEGTIGVATVDEQFEAKASDLLQNLKFTAGGHFEARNPQLSFIADVFFVGLSQDAEIQKTILNNTITQTGEANIDEWIIEGAAGYRVSKEFELLVAGRYYSMDAEILVEEELKGSANKSWADIFFGARYLSRFAEDWFATVRADIGFGGSTFAWFGTAGLGYSFSELFSLAFNYRILSLDYESGSGLDYFKYDAATHGFGLAAVFTF